MAFKIHRTFAPRVQRWVTRCAQEGIQIIITQAWRPVAYQQELLDCWNDPTNDYECRKRRGIVVKPAAPGSSFHNCAEAIDATVLPAEKLGRAVQLAEEENIFWGGWLSTPDIVHWDAGPRTNRPAAVAAAMQTFNEADLVDLKMPPIIRGGPLWTEGR